MPTKIYKQKLLKHRISSVARVLACASFLVLTIIGVSSLVRAMSLTVLAVEDGIPAQWINDISTDHPDTITVPITYWDQRQEDCWPTGEHYSDDQLNQMSMAQRIARLRSNRQFEWSICKVYGEGVESNLVQKTLGSDGLPVPTYANSAAAAAKNVHITSQGVTAENFYRWFHEVEGVSERIDGQTMTFHRTGNNEYVYGGSSVFPIDDLTHFSDSDSASKKNHNFHFTAHMQIPVRIEADGKERFDFTGDDDVWVFLNNQLVLDIGGVHEAISGHFTINTDGTINYVVEDRKGDITAENINIGVKKGDIVNLDFFYAERSTDESNTKITISEMTWPIVAQSTLESTIEDVVTNGDNVVIGDIIQHEATISNMDASTGIDVERIAAHITETYHTSSMQDGETDTVSGFVPLETIDYTYHPEDPESWQSAEINLPAADGDGFALKESIPLDKAGKDNDTLTIRYLTASSGETGTMESDVAFYTTSYDTVSVVHSRATVNYAVPTHKIRIEYRVEDGDATPPATEVYTFKEGLSYNLPTKTLAGYTSDLEYATGTADEDRTHVVTFTRIKSYYDLTISYVDDETGAELEPDYTANLIEGSPYSVTSPEVEGYTCLTPVVSGTLNAPATITVRYSKNAPEIIYHNLTIRYEYAPSSDDEAGDAEGPREAAPAHTEELEHGTSYSVTSPEIEDYTPNLAVVSGSLDSDVEIIVYYTPVIHTYAVTINYVYENGDEVTEPYLNEYRSGASFTIPSPEIEGYTADQPVVTATVENEPLIITVTYIKNPDPVLPPASPTSPSRPSTPNKPTVDVGPDGELTYTGPLGEVAIVVPNTGVISSMLSPIFDHYFADIILSQTFLMITLFIFSASFATAFSLRRYLNLAVASRPAGRGHQTLKKTANMNKSATTSKSTLKTTAKSSAKAVKKSVRQTARVTKAAATRTARAAKTTLKQDAKKAEREAKKALQKAEKCAKKAEKDARSAAKKTLNKISKKL